MKPELVLYHFEKHIEKEDSSEQNDMARKVDSFLILYEKCSTGK